MQTLAQLRSGALSGITRLKISENLTEFPPEILELSDTLEILDLSGNKLNCLPPEFSVLKKLKIAFLSDNLFTEFPEILGTLPELEMIGFKANQISKIPANAFPEKLRWLILTDNQITELPAAIGQCSRLQKLMLAGNKLQKLPSELTFCKNLELLRISANAIKEIPEWLFSLPKLTWLALAGNPSTEHQITSEILPEINWSTLKPEKLLGEGASGNIYKTVWQTREKVQHVAVKIFKGAVTSDGLPSDEMAAMISAGVHPNIIPVLGKIAGHPEQKQGLVLELIPPEFKILGNPPSFQTCTRDTFPNGTVFSLKSLGKIASGIAAAVAHLHEHGILHGDLYAHNILINPAAEPLLSDFGAATVYNLEDKMLSQNFEKPEVRAFGYLLDDLLTYLDPSEKNQPQVQAFQELKTKCLQEDPVARPDFATIVRKINEIISSNAAII